MLIQLAFVLVAIIIGARLGGIGLGVLGGLGLAVLTFVFDLEPTSPPYRCDVNDRSGHCSSQLYAGCRRVGPDGEMGGKAAS